MSLFDLVFGCWHKRCSFPITVGGKLRRSTAASVTGTYVVCLDCGCEFPYDWSQMKMLASKPRTGWTAEPATSFPVSKWLEPCTRGIGEDPTFAFGSADNLLFPGREVEVPLLN